MKSKKIDTPEMLPEVDCDNAKDAVKELQKRYEQSTTFLRETFADYAQNGGTKRKRAFYPKVSFKVDSHVHLDNRLSFGHVSQPGVYETTITRPDLFENYLAQQIQLVMDSHSVKARISQSDTPIPVHFAMQERSDAEVITDETLLSHLRDYFDVPELDITNDDIVNGNFPVGPNGELPLAPFTAQRIDYSLLRLSHYTATSPQYFQNHVLFTNYQFYVDEFREFALNAVKTPKSGYKSFVEPGNFVTTIDGATGTPAARSPQMPAFHLTRENGDGITLVNIGVGPSNAKTITDHIAVMRPHAWIMVGHCAGLRASQRLGDYVLAHAYLREDHVLDADLPTWVPIPALAEIQQALEGAISDVTELTGYEQKRILRTGTVATIDNRNWELRESEGPVRRLSQSRAIALDMESATIAANGFRFRVPYGTLLCVSDRPLHGELKLPGMASAFYNTQVSQHLLIGIRAMERIREMPLERVHSRKLRSFSETAFL